MNASIVSLIFTALVAVFILAGILFGIIRGFRKTAFRGIFLVATALILLLFSGLFAGLLINMNISFLGITINGQTPKTAEQAIRIYVDLTFGEGTAENNIQLIKTMLSFVKLFLTTVMFWILFVAFKYLLLPLNSYLYRVIFRSRDERKYSRLKKQLKKSHGEVLAFASIYDGNGEVTPIEPNNESQNVADATSGAAVVSEQVEPNQQPDNTDLSAAPVDNQKAEVENLDSKKEEYAPKDEYSPAKEHEVEQLEEINEKIEPPKKPKKRRLLGALLGIPVGLFCAAMILMPINGLLKLAIQIDQYEAVAMNSEEGYVTHMSNGIFPMISEGYSSSIGNKILTYSGAMAISNFTFETLATKRINDVSVNLSKDAVKLVDVANRAYELKSVDFRNYERESLDSTIDKVGEVAELTLNIGIVKSALEVVVPFGVDYAISKNILNANENIKPIITTALTSLKEIKNRDLVKEIKGGLNVIKQVNLKLEDSEESVLSTVLKGGTTDYFGMISQISDENVDSLVNSLFNYEDYVMQSTSSLIPDLIAGGFKTLEPTINSTLNNTENQFVYSDTAESIRALVSTKQEQSESFKQILKGVIAIAKNYKSSVGDAVISGGPVLQQLKGNKLMSTQSYSSLIVAAQEFANRSAKDLLSTAGVKDETIFSITSGLASVDNWVDECDYLGNAYKIYDSNNSSESKVLPMNGGNIDLTKTKFAIIGKILDKATEGELLGGGKVNNVICDLIDSHTNQSELGDFAKYLNIDNADPSIDIKKQLILNVKSVTNFEQELTLVGNSIGGDSPLINFNDLRTDVAANISSVGLGLDELTKGNIVTNNIVRLLIKNVSEDYKKENPTSATDNAINNFIDEVNNNLSSAIANNVQFTWANELSKISNLNGLDPSNLEAVGAKLDQACDGSVLITKRTIANMFETISNSYKVTVTPEHPTLTVNESAINGFIDDINSNLDSAITNNVPFTWANELSKVSKLSEVSSNAENLSYVGAKLDEACEGSVLITNPMVANMLRNSIQGFYIYEADNVTLATSGNGKAINDFFDSIAGTNGTLNSVTNESIMSWEKEFGILDQLQQTSSNLNNITDESNLQASYFEALDNAAFNYKKVGSQNIDDDEKNSVLITKLSIIELASSLMDGIGYETAAPNSVEEKINLFLSDNLELTGSSGTYRMGLNFNQINQPGFNFANANNSEPDGGFKWVNEITCIKNCINSLKTISNNPTNMAIIDAELTNISNYSNNANIIAFEHLS